MTELDIPTPPWLRKMMQPIGAHMLPAQVHHASNLLRAYDECLRDLSDIADLANGDLGPFHVKMYRKGIEGSHWEMRTDLPLIDVLPLLKYRLAALHAELTALGVEI